MQGRLWAINSLNICTIEDQSLRRQKLEGLRRQLEFSITSALDAQSRLQAYSDRTGRTTLTPATPVSTPLTRATANPTSGVTTQLLPDPLSFMYAGSSDRGHRNRRSRDRNDFSMDRPQRLSSRRSRDRDNLSRDRPHCSSGSRRSRDRDDFSEDRTQRLSGARRPRDQEDDDESRPYRSSRLRRSRDPDERRDDRARRSWRSSQPTSSLHHHPNKDWLPSVAENGQTR